MSAADVIDADPTDARPPPLHIAMVSTPWFPLPPGSYGGIETMCADLVDGLVERGHRVTVIGVAPNGTRGEFVPTLPEPQSARLGRVNPEVLHAALAARAVARLHPDVVHDHSTAGPLHAVGRRSPTVVTTHLSVQGETGDYYRALADSVHLVAISHAQQVLAPDLHWAGTVHNAVRVDAYPYREVKAGFVLYLGRFAREKGVHLAIDAARAAELPVVLAGRVNDPAEQPYVDREVRPRLAEDVTLIGEVGFAEKVDLLSRARCLIFPICWEEPFGMVMVEAMACGTPVVALRHGAVPEVVEHGATGYVVDRADELGPAIRAVARLSPAACRERVRRCFDAAGMAAGYESVYEKALSLRSARRG